MTDRTLKDIITDITEQELAENCPDVPFTREDLHELVNKRKKERRKKYFKRTAVAAVLIFTCFVFIVGAGPDRISVDADKNAKEEIITDDGVIIEDKGWGSSSEDGVVITDWKEVPVAKAHVEELLIPGYIPEGYEFESLIIQNFGDENNTATYIFRKDDYKIVIGEHINGENLQATILPEERQSINTTKGTVYLKKENDKNMATIKTNDGIVVDLRANISNDELINIIEQLN